MHRARPHERRARAALPPELRARVLAAARSPSAPRSAVLRRALATVTSAFALPVALVVALGAAHAAHRSVAAAATTAAGCAAIAALALWGALRRARSRGRPSMLGPPRAWLVAFAALTPIVDLAWLLAAKLRREPSPTRATVTCFALLVFFAAAPLAALLHTHRMRDPVHPRATGAALGAAAGAWAAAVLDLFCESGAPWHLALGHALPALALAALGAAVGDRALGVR